MVNVERIHFCHYYYLSFVYFEKSKIVTHYTYLYTSLSKVNFHRQIFSCEHIWIVGLSKCCFQFFQLLQCKCGTISTLFTSHKCFIMDGRMIWIAGICNKIKLQKANNSNWIDSYYAYQTKGEAFQYSIDSNLNKSNLMDRAIKFMNSYHFNFDIIRWMQIQERLTKLFQ